VGEAVAEGATCQRNGKSGVWPHLNYTDNGLRYRHFLSYLLVISDVVVFALRLAQLRSIRGWLCKTIKFYCVDRVA
jgi:hypothetical protein